MAYQIVVTPESEETLTSVHHFIKENFGNRSAESFLNKADKIIQLISELPYMYKAAPFDEAVRIGLISKQTSLFYRVKEESIELLFFWDNRQDSII